MEYPDVAVGLDIGTTKILVIVGQKNKNNKIRTLGLGCAKSIGVHRGVVNNITKTIDSIKSAIFEAEKSSGIKIKEVTVGIAGQHIRSLQYSDYIIRSNFEEVINENDLKRLVNQVHKLAMLPGEEIIHVLPQQYKIDNQGDIKEPIGMYGNRLEANFHLVIGQVSSIRNIGRCVKASGLIMSGITLEPLASAEAVLSIEEREAGVALVDIGGGTTDIAIFKDNIIRHTAIIPFGGNIITEDVKVGCSIIERQAEQLKVKFGSAWPEEKKNTEIVSIPGLRGRESKEISLKCISQIINARVSEILEQVYIEIKNYGHEKQEKKLIAGLVMTGGGAQLNHICSLSEWITGMNVRIGYSNEHLAIKEEYNLSHPEYATAIGLVMKGLENSSFIENKKFEFIDQPIIKHFNDKKNNSKNFINPKKNEKIKKKTKSFIEIWADKFRQMLNDTD